MANHEEPIGFSDETERGGDRILLPEANEAYENMTAEQLREMAITSWDVILEFLHR